MQTDIQGGARPSAVAMNYPPMAGRKASRAMADRLDALENVRTRPEAAFHQSFHP
jgi:hypothetical protein